MLYSVNVQCLEMYSQRSLNGLHGMGWSSLCCCVLSRMSIERQREGSYTRKPIERSPHRFFSFIAVGDESLR